LSRVTRPPTRERILYAAAELFRRQGYAGTGLNQVVAEANAPFGSLYHHFPGGKQQLAEEVIYAGGAFFEALVTAVYDTQATPEASVRAVFGGAAETLKSTNYQDACPIATIALDIASTNEPLRRAIQNVFEQWISALTDRLGNKDHALAVLSALEGAFVLCRAQRTTVPLHAAGEMAAALVSHQE
jgi:AcrR family transcriptional regulator